jgi:hypothetical protein
MKTLLATLIGLTTITFATAAFAYVVAVPTSFSTAEISQKGDLEAALQSAVDDVVSHAISFTPTFVTVQNARVVGDRMFILLLIGDDEGAKMLQMFSADENKPEAGKDAPDADGQTPDADTATP